VPGSWAPCPGCSAEERAPRHLPQLVGRILTGDHQRSNGAIPPVGSGQTLRARHRQYEAKGTSQFLVFDELKGLDGKQLGAINQKLGAAREALAKNGVTDPAKGLEQLTAEERKVVAASIAGDRQTLRTDSVIPATMALIYLLLALWFRTQGGYRVLRIGKDGAVEAVPPAHGG
jgi:hypothetical protein